MRLFISHGCLLWPFHINDVDPIYVYDPKTSIIVKSHAPVDLRHHFLTDVILGRKQNMGAWWCKGSLTRVYSACCRDWQADSSHNTWDKNKIKLATEMRKFSRLNILHGY